VPLIESIKENIERLTGWDRPTRREVDAAPRHRKPSVFHFADDGLVPNNPKLPFVVYRGPVRLVDVADPASSKGRVLKLRTGDVAILPAGTGHERLDKGPDFLVVGAYPAAGKYDESRASAEDHDRAIKTIPKAALPRKDPVYGRVALWCAYGRVAPDSKRRK
jgi:uncharacterized protein YjlB